MRIVFYLILFIYNKELADEHCGQINGGLHITPKGQQTFSHNHFTSQEDASDGPFDCSGFTN